MTVVGLMLDDIDAPAQTPLALSSGPENAGLTIWPLTNATELACCNGTLTCCSRSYD